VSELPAELLSFVIQFIHPEKTNVGPTGATFDDHAIAAYFGTDVETYRAIKTGYTVAARCAAVELLAEPDFTARVDRLPFAPGSTIVGLGDSITDDYQSWLEILRNLKAIRKVVTERTGAHWIWMTPSTVLLEKISAQIFMEQQQLNLSQVNADLAAVAQQVRQMPDPVVDLQALFGLPARVDLLLPDGLHPSLDGQKVILRALVEKLAASFV
jgi:lysophospholipase L1-like esterase